MDLIIKDMTIDDFGTCDYDDNNYLIGTGRVDEAEEVAPVRYGRWVNGKCSECGCEPLRRVFRRGELIYSQSNIFNYCPNCGASMVNEDEEMSKVAEMEMAYGEYLND